MNEIVKVPDIAVCHGGALHSLRGQGVVKSSSLERFEGGSGVVKEGVLYVLDSLEIEIVRMTTTRIDPLFWVVSNSGIKVDWGDGTIETNVFSHTYADGVAEHTILFWGRDSALISFRCFSNQLTTLDISKNIALTYLHCAYNPLTALEVSQNTVLKELFCYDNQLITLDVSKNIALIGLDCDNNQLTTLDVSKNTALVKLSCCLNPFASDPSEFTATVNTLVDRTGIEAGDLYLLGEVGVEPIRDICATKNWNITVSL